MDDRANWEDARQVAVSYGGDLAALNDAYEWLTMDGTYGLADFRVAGGLSGPQRAQ